jgi:predicted nucleotidyltransferase
MRRHRYREPSPSVAEPRRPLLLGAYSFVRAARFCPGVRRIALLGSLATAKAIPKDVDLLVTVEREMDLTQLARAGRRPQGLAQTINLGADIFLADSLGRYPATRRTRGSRGAIADQAGTGPVINHGTPHPL